MSYPRGGPHPSKVVAFGQGTVAIRVARDTWVDDY